MKKTSFKRLVQLAGKQHILSGFLAFQIVVLLSLTSTTTGCGAHPTALYSSKDIKRASRNLEQVSIPFLPLDDYPLLSKFERLRDIDFFTLDGSGGSDEKLKALSKLRFHQLSSIGLLNCPRVTDEGIRHLSRIPTLTGLQLEGTSIGDEAMTIMASKTNLTGVNVANCPKVTILGLLKFAAKENVVSFSFSADALSQAEVVQLIKEFKNVKWSTVVDPKGKLDATALEALAREKGLALNISRTGALQDVVSGGSRR